MFRATDPSRSPSEQEPMAAERLKLVGGRERATEMQVTVGVSALIVHDGCLILVKKEDATGVSYILPGGRQEGGETLEQGRRRGRARYGPGRPPVRAPVRPLPSHA